MSQWSQWYHKNKETQYRRIKKNFQARRARIREWLRAQKGGTKCCIHCGIGDQRVLDFHHRNPKTKKFEISNAIRLNYSTKTIQAEIEKCDILCANCHRILHYGN